MDIIKDYAEKHSFCKVNSLKLSFGALSLIESKALELAFTVASMDTLAQGAQLQFEIQPIIIGCINCDKESTVKEFPSMCPECGSGEVILVAGIEELKILEMDVD